MFENLFHYYKVEKNTPAPESLKVLGFEMLWEDVLREVLKEGLEKDLEIKNSMKMVKVVKVYKNKRNTLSLICTPEHVAFYDNKFVCTYSDYVKAMSYKHEPHNVKEGDYLVLNFNTGWANNEIREHRYIAIGGTPKEWKAVIDDIIKVKSLYAFPEMNKVPNVEGGTTLDLSQFKKVLKGCEEAVALFLKNEEKEKQDRERAMNAVVVEGNKMTWKAVDDITYTVSNMTKEKLSNTIFLGRYEEDSKSWCKKNTCIDTIVGCLQNEKGEHLLSANGRELTIEHKRFRKDNNAEIHRDYINGVNVVSFNVEKTVRDYIIGGIPIPRREKLDVTSVPKKKPENEEQLIKGNIVDLEGNFTIEVTCHKKEGKWYMEVCGEDIRVMGGAASIESMQNLTKENTWRYTVHASDIFLKKLEKAIGNDKALEVFDRLKMMSILSEKLGGAKDEQK